MIEALFRHSDTPRRVKRPASRASAVATASSISAHVFVIFAIRTRRRDFSHLRYYNDFSEEFTPGRLPGELFPRRVLARISAIPLVALCIFLWVALI